MQRTRRQILKDATLGAGAFVLSPIISQIAAQAAGTIDARRFVFVVKTSGLIPGTLVPAGLSAKLTENGKEPGEGDGYRAATTLRPAEKLVDASIVDDRLPDSMASLDPFKSRLAIVQGLSGQMNTGGHSSWYGCLGCYKTNSTTHTAGDPVAPTIDGLLGTLRPGVFPHVGYAYWTTLMGGSRADSVTYPGISAIGRNQPLPFQGDPHQGFNDLFGSIATGEAKARFDLRDNVLDRMRDDLNRLQLTLAPAEREKLDRHVEAIEQLQRRRKMLSQMGPQLAKHAPKLDPRYESVREIDRISAYFDLASAALISGLTNVVTIRPDSLGMMYEGLGLTEKNVHGIGHGGSSNGHSPAECRAIIRQFHFEQIARLAADLDKVPEGDGTMLDNTVIVYLSDSGNEHHASLKEWPIVVVGGIKGRLKTGGRYIQYPVKGNAGHHTIANWWMTLLHAAGHPQDTFGSMDGDIPVADQQGPLQELLG